MSDEQPIEQPKDPFPEPERTQPLTVNERKAKNRGALEKLPPEVREELDHYIQYKNPSAARKYIVEKYGKQFPVLEGITKVTFYKYAERHNLQSGLDTALQTQIINTPPELKKVIDNFSDTSISLSDKKAALTSLFNDCAATSKRLEEQQTNFLDPQIQMVILQNRKQMCTIIEKLSVLSDQLSKDSDKNYKADTEELIQVLTVAVINSYKITHTDQALYEKFMTEFLARMTDLLKNYRSSKEVIKKDLPKSS